MNTVKILKLDSERRSHTEITKEIGNVDGRDKPCISNSRGKEKENEEGMLIISQYLLAVGFVCPTYS